MIESLCLISVKFPFYILMLDSYFSHAMKFFTIQSFLKVHFFFPFYTSENSCLTRLLIMKSIKILRKSGFKRSIAECAVK
jgi:hypothetical protein